MEAITTALVGAAGSAATATTAATAATGGLLGFGGQVTLGGVLSSALALGSAGLSLGGAMGQARALETQAEWGDFNATTETLRGEQEANRVREVLLRTLASNNAGRAAAGVELSGSAIEVDAQAAEAAERELDIVGSNARARAAVARAKAQSQRVAANSTRLDGVGSAATSLFGYVERRRGTG